MVRQRLDVSRQLHHESPPPRDGAGFARESSRRANGGGPPGGSRGGAIPNAASARAAPFRWMTMTRSRAPRSCGRATTATRRAARRPPSCRGRPSRAPTGCAPSRRRAAPRAGRRSPGRAIGVVAACSARGRSAARDPVAVAEDHRVLDDVVELAHVALPRQRHEDLHGRAVDALEERLSSRLCMRTKCSTSGGMSSRRSRSGGISMPTTFRR